MRGIAASSLSGYNKVHDVYRTNPARTSGVEIDVDFEYLRQFCLCHIQSSRFLKVEWGASNGERGVANRGGPAKLCCFSSLVEDMEIFSASGSSAVVEHFEKNVHTLYGLILGEHKYNHQCRAFSRSSHGKSWSHSEIFVSLESSVVNSSSVSQPD